MPAIVKSGMTGDGVGALQAMLNASLPALTAPLNVDSIFGPKTLARTIAFQKAFELTPDGIVGARTWTKLDEVCPLPSAARKTCGNGDPGNIDRGKNLVQRMGGSGFALQTRSGLAVGDSDPKPPPGLLKPIRANPHFQAAAAVFFASLDYDKIFWTTQSGLQDRPFTAGVRNPLTGEAIQILNLGDEWNKRNTVVHEMTHAWQSQHHHDPLAYMGACIGCQAAALNKNLGAVVFHPSVRKMPNFPVDRPFSAYGNIAGKPFGDYGGEMIADQVERGVEDICRIVRSAQPHVSNPDNVKSLLKTVVTDMRDPAASEAT